MALNGASQRSYKPIRKVVDLNSFLLSIDKEIVDLIRESWVS
ncbi:hypothetical protein ACPOL_4169 [Acidisarcina polymorpha]|uniref:Uncharacterized protein n=1 Tax=Acidisarcina polymorpha TaxID=2211140 RepID=A0A2Z5G4J9_9BACT|nr:hypothetical protein ACPOL_4169 [Acidisarcina polymorpha]